MSFNNQIRSYRDAAKINEIISEDFVRKLEIPNEVIATKFNRGIRVKKQFAQKIFFRFLKIIIEECMLKNVRFVSPSRFWFSIYIKEMNKNNRQRILKNKEIYKDVELINSDFKLYEFVLFSSYLKGFNNNRRIRIAYQKYKELIRLVNKGKRYHS